MATRRFVLTVSIAAVTAVSGVGAAQHETHQTSGAAAPSSAQLMQCRHVQPVIAGLLEAALKRLEDARLTNSPAALRDAAEDVQGMLVDMRGQLAPCGEMREEIAEAPVPQTTPSVLQAPASEAPAAAAPRGVPEHAGHAVAAPRPSPAPARPVVPAASDPHGGHATSSSGAAAGTPVASAPATPARAAPAGTARPATSTPPTNIADLKCTNAVDQKTAPRMLYQGRMYYFCTEASRAEFAKDPAKHVTAPPAAAPAHAH